MRYKAVLLDMDGTVLDTLEDLASAVNHSLERFGLPQVSVEQVRASLGNGAAWLIGHCVPEGCPKALEERVLAFYKPYYDAHCRERTRPYEGIPALLAALRQEGVKLAIISNKPDPAVRELAAAFFPGLLSAAVGESARVQAEPGRGAGGGGEPVPAPERLRLCGRFRGGHPDGQKRGHGLHQRKLGLPQQRAASGGGRGENCRYGGGAGAAAAGGGPGAGALLR